MKRDIIILLIIVIISFGFYGCSEGEPEGSVDVQVNDVDSYETGSIDEVAINNVRITLREWNQNEMYADLIINITNKFDFDCSTIGLELKIMDGNNNVLEKTNVTAENIAAGQSKDATVMLNDYSTYENMKTIEVYDYGAWKTGDKEVVEGTFSQKQVFDISEITVKRESCEE